MEKNPANVTSITNDTEHSFVIERDNGHTDLSILVPAGDDPAHFAITDYANGQNEPLSQRKLYKEEAELTRKLLNDPKSQKILGNT